ncbi:MAG: hypothetical protein O8C67_07710 [Candidatus Methanoperedens sp.]|nr:hypothetical protein [Candidatus Methanoperedens sp.]
MRNINGVNILLVALITVSLTSIGTAETTWTKYNDNPVNLENGAGSPSLIFDGSNYKMWYALNSEIYYATSTDGITWIKYGKVLNKGSIGSWEETGIAPQTVIFNGLIYKMWYEGYSGTTQYAQIGYATSSDGINWTKYSGNPVLSPGGNGGWDDWSLSDPSVILDGSAYKIWYAAQSVQYGTSKIGYATSSDGINWTKYSGNPVLNPGGNGGWDDKHVYHQTVLKDNTSYKMWYIGLESSDIGRIGYATSSDGITWTKYGGNPVLNLGNSSAWDGANLATPFVLFYGNSYKMWYGGYNGSIWRIGFALTSEPTNSIGYSATVATGQNTYVQSSNGTFGLLLKGQTKTVNNSVVLNNTGDISAKVEARFNDSISGDYGLVSGTNLLNATNFALGIPGALMPRWVCRMSRRMGIIAEQLY